MKKFTGITQYKKSHFRYRIIFMVFIVTVISYADRSILSIAGNNIASDLGINEIMMGYIFSSFSWAYVIGQIPGGMLIDKFGTKRVYGSLIHIMVVVIVSTWDCRLSAPSFCSPIITHPTIFYRIGRSTFISYKFEDCSGMVSDERTWICDCDFHFSTILCRRNLCPTNWMDFIFVPLAICLLPVRMHRGDLCD